MARVLVLLILGVVIFRLLKRVLSEATATRATPTPAATGAIAFTPVAACAFCGVHVPLGDSVVAADGRSYCCEAHRLQAHGQGR